jgi:N-methylhydantoinase A
LAEGIIQIAVAKMVGSIREISIEKGKDPRDYVLVPFGGAGPMHAIPIARALQINRIFIPKFPGNLSALGLLASDLKIDLVKTHLVLFSALRLDELDKICTALRDQGVGILLKEGLPRSKVSARFSIDIRYYGQSFELTIPYKPQKDTVNRLRKRFYRYYREAYGHGKEAGECELINVRATISKPVPKPELFYRFSKGAKSSAEAVRERREVYFYGQNVSTPVYDRELLHAADRIEGPAIIEEEGSTIVIFPDWAGTVDSLGNLTLEALSKTGAK